MGCIVGKVHIFKCPISNFLAAGNVQFLEIFGILTLDRTWAQCLVWRAADRHRSAAEAVGADAVRRFELLQLRFGEGNPIREIARLWGADPARLHREYGKAREEFREALVAEVRFHRGGSTEAVEEECRQLIGLLA